MKASSAVDLSKKLPIAGLPDCARYAIELPGLALSELCLSCLGNILSPTARLRPSLHDNSEDSRIATLVPQVPTMTDAVQLCARRERQNGSNSGAVDTVFARNLAKEIVREVGAAESVSVTLAGLCEDASGEEAESILLDGPSLADLLLDCRDVLLADPNATSDPSYILPSSSSSFSEDGVSGVEESDTVVYPAMEAATSSVVTLQSRQSTQGGKKSSIDNFLTNLSNAYKGAKREENSLVNLRISLIAEQGRGPQVQALGFRSERDYWGLISAISRALVRRDEGVSWSGFCELPGSANSSDNGAGDGGRGSSGSSNNSGNNNGSDSKSASNTTNSTGTAKQKILSIFTGTSKAKHEADGDRVEVKGLTLTVTSNGAVAYSLDLNTLRALSLTSDWVEPKPYILEIRIAAEASETSRVHLGGIRLALMGTDLEPVSSPQYYRRMQASSQQIGIGVNENILLPLNLQEVLQHKSSNGLTSVAVLTGMQFDGSAASAAHPAGIQTIPFNLFLALDKATPRRASIISYSKEAVAARDQAAAAAAAAPPQLRLNEQFVNSISVSQEAPRRVVRVHITGSTGIPSSRLGAPSAYCAVYLVDDLNNRLSDGATGSVIEFKTQVIKGNNPTWDKDIYIEMPSGDGTTDTVAGVLITVKDAGGGLLKPLHLGQVVVPIGCFIEGHEAQLCLPLEPTARMPKSVLNLGEIHISTQLITTGAGSPSSLLPPSPSSPNSQSVSTSPRDRKRSSSAGLQQSPVAPSVPVSYTLRPALALGVSWPFHILSATGTGEINTGHLACGQTSLRLALSPGHGGVLASCQEARGGVGVGRGGGVIIIDWSNVVDTVALTEACLMVTIIVNKMGTVAMGGRGSIAPATHQGKVQLELLVAPCPSRKLQEALLDRQNLATVRAELRQLVTMVQKSRAAAQPVTRNRQATALGIPSGVASSQQQQLQVQQQQQQQQQQQTAGLTADAILPVARVILADLERVIDDAVEGMSGIDKIAARNQAPQVDSFGYAASPKEVMISLAPCSVTTEMRKKAAIRTHARARLYQALLMHVCKSLPRGPTYSLDAVRAAVEADCKQLGDGAPLAASALATELIDRHARLMDLHQARLADYILCSADHWRPNNSLTFFGSAPDGGEREVSSKAGDCIAELIKCFQGKLRGLLSAFTSSADAFKRTPGQEAKMAIIKLVMYHDGEFDALVKKKLEMVRMTVKSALTLIGPKYSLQDLVSWYQASLVVETQTWLSKTMQNFALFKLNGANLPWDIEEVGGKVLSALPETLQQQMNIYLALCEEEEAMTGRGSISPPSDGLSSHLSEDRVEYNRSLLLTMRGKIVEAVAKCMLLLSDEYRRALQSKHWERPSREGDDLEKNFHFLMAVANDCLRVCNFQVDAQFNLPGGVGSSEVHSNVVMTFMATADIAIRYLIRIIFCEVYTLLADLDEYWAIPAEQATKTLIGVLNSYFVHLRPKLDDRFVDKLVTCCASIVSTRFLLMLKDRGGAKRKFSVEEVKRYCFDVQQLRNCFSAARASAVEPKALSVFLDTAELLSKPLAEIRPLFRVVAKEHQGADSTGTLTVRAGSALLQCILLQVRPDTTAEMESAVRAAVDEAAKVPSSWHPFPQEQVEQSVVHRVFGADTDRSGGGGGGGDKGTLKHLREKASNVLNAIGKRRRKMEEEDVRILRILGLDLDLIDDNDAVGGEKNDDDDDHSSITASMMPSGALAHIDEADLITVTVSQIRVQGLRGSSLFGSVNPYLAFTLGGQRLKTPVAWNCSTGKARWECTLSFRYSKSRLAGGHARLKVEVFDKERLRRKRALGSISVKLAGLDLFRVESWLALEGGDSVQSQTGEAYIVVDIADRS